MIHTGPVPGWPPGIEKISICSSIDRSEQPALFYSPSKNEPVPLLVSLHTWSADYLYPEPFYAHWCKKREWALIRPNFRGPNNRPEACGSELSVADVVDAVNEARNKANIAPERIYLAGVSGGAHAALLIAGRHPQIWAAVSAWCPIFSLANWHAEHRGGGQPDNYARNLESACGGPPEAGLEVSEQYRRRSPAHWLSRARGVPIDINAGIRDGHQGSVPVSHSLGAYNLLSDEGKQISHATISALAAKPEVPAEYRWPGTDPLYVRGPVLYRQTSEHARVSLFQGGHEIFPEAAFAWLSKQRKGQKPVWNIDEAADEDLLRDSSEASK